MTDRIPLDHLTDDQLNALYDQLDALRAVSRGYCSACGRGDAAPTIADWEHQRQRAVQAEERARKAERAANLLAYAHRRAEEAEAALEEYRSALSERLELGNGAPWDVILTRAEEATRLAGREWTQHQIAEKYAELMAAGRDCLAEERDDAEQRAERAEAALNRIRQIHNPAIDWARKPLGCHHNGEHTAPCLGCKGECWPCPTIRALDKEPAPAPAEATGPDRCCGKPTGGVCVLTHDASLKQHAAAIEAMLDQTKEQ